MNNEISTTALVIIAASGGVGALIAGIVAAWVNWLTEKSRASRENAAWVKEKKASSFAALLADARVMVAGYTTAESEARAQLRETIMSFNQREFEVRLLLNDDNLPEFDRLRGVLGKATEKDEALADAARRGVYELTRLLRKDLTEAD